MGHDVKKPTDTAVAIAANVAENLLRYGRGAANRTFVGDLLLFSKYGDYNAGQEKIEIPLRSRFAIYINSFCIGSAGKMAVWPSKSWDQLQKASSRLLGTRSVTSTSPSGKALKTGERKTRGLSRTPWSWLLTTRSRRDSTRSRQRARAVLPLLVSSPLIAANTCDRSPVNLQSSSLTAIATLTVITVKFAFPSST